MATERYEYAGPLTGFSYIDAETGERRELMLAPGATVELPAEQPFVVRLVAMSRLTAIADAAPATESREPKRRSAKDNSPEDAR